MPKRQNSAKKNKLKSTSLAELFTNRDKERKLIKEFCRAINGSKQPLNTPVLHFYGVGGAGKSSLLKKATDEWHDEKQESTLKIAQVDFDSDQVKNNYTILEVLRDIRLAVAAQNLDMPYFDALYVLLWSRYRPGEELLLQQNFAEKLTDVSSETISFITEFFNDAVDATGMLKLAIKKMNQLKQHKRIIKIKETLSFVALEDIVEFDEMLQRDILTEYFGIELQAILNDQKKLLMLTIDGYEQIQHNGHLDDYMQSMLSYAALDNPSGNSRLGIIIIGREKISSWQAGDNELLDSSKHIGHHHLGGLTKKDAQEFIKKAINFYKKQKHERVAILLGQNESAILNACAEVDIKDGETCYHPYYLDLSHEIIFKHGDNFKSEKHLGSTPKELQQRFFKYMDDNEKNYHSAMAWAEYFDWTLIKELLIEKLISNLDQLSFTSFVDNHSYVLSYGDSTTQYTLHRMMRESLIDYSLQTGSASMVVNTLIPVYKANFRRLDEKENCYSMNKDYLSLPWRLSELILTARERGIKNQKNLNFDLFTYLSREIFECPNAFDVTKKEKYLHQELAWQMKNKQNETSAAIYCEVLARIYENQKKYSKAEEHYKLAIDLYRQATINDQIHILDINMDLAYVLKLKKEYLESEALYQHILLTLLEYPQRYKQKIYSCERNLADISLFLSTFEKAEKLYMKILRETHNSVTPRYSENYAKKDPTETSYLSHEGSIETYHEVYYDDVIPTILENLALCLEGQKKHVETENIYREILECYYVNPSEYYDSFKRIDVLKKFNEILKLNGKLEESKATLKELNEALIWRNTLH